jgi:putative ABC transport system permease protein
VGVRVLTRGPGAGGHPAALPWLGRRLDGTLRRLPSGAFLALRRVFAAQGAARLVVVTTALSLGLVVYAGALADSTNRTIAAKASVATGSDVVVPLPPNSEADGHLPAGAMVVGTENDSTVVPGDVDANVLVVRPDEFGDVARWNDALAEQPLDELMAALRGYDGDRVPVVLSGTFPDSALDAAAGELTVDFGYYTMPVQVVGRADAFPGQGDRAPLLVAEWDRYVAAIEAANRDPGLVLSREVWARGDLEPVLGTLASAGFVPRSPDDVGSAAAFATRPELHAQGWSLDYLRAVALAAGVLGLVGLTMQAVAQQRRRTVGALLLRRMGMSRRTTEASSGLEIGLLAGLAALVAVAVALPSSALVLRLLDPVPSLPPTALFDVPWGSIAAVAGGVVLVTSIGALLVGRTARRATGGQVMRDAA